MKKEYPIRVAYAEDHTSMRLGIISFLQQLGGITVDMQAANGRELIDQLEKAEMLPDVCMLDINMPEMDGFETVQVIKQRWPPLKTLIFTAFEDELYLVRMIALGANGYLIKRCHPGEVKQALMAIHTNNYYYRDANARQLYSKVKNGSILLPHFSNREAEFLKLCPTDLSYSEIAELMNTTVKAIDGYRDRLCEKLDVKGRIGLAIYAIQLGFVQFGPHPKPMSLINGLKNKVH